MNKDGVSKRSLPWTIDYKKFDNRLSKETGLLEDWFIEQKFQEQRLKIGSELEFFLLDKNYQPYPENLNFIENLNAPWIQPEVGKAHLEINSAHLSLEKNCLSALHENLLNYWQQSVEQAKKSHCHVAVIGALPTATERHFQRDFITNQERYFIIDKIMAKHRNNNAINLDIRGKESLKISTECLAVDGLLSALQLHLQVGFSQSVKYYNVSQAIASLTVALSCNSPYIFGHQLWHESRIAVFDQTMRLKQFDRSRGFSCCSFGIGYINQSLFELFDQNYQFYPRLFPLFNDTQALESMFHVKTQNAVVYRWNRPVIDFDAALIPHLRIEHRGPSSGPTIIDMVANAAYFYGLLHYYSIQPSSIEHLLPFHIARRNFFNAARNGLQAKLRWFIGHEVPAVQLLEDLLPLVRKGLLSLDIDKRDINFYLEIIKQRLKKKTGGADWQMKFIEKYGRNFNSMMEAYLANQYQEKLISEWKI